MINPLQRINQYQNKTKKCINQQKYLNKNTLLTFKRDFKQQSLSPSRDISIKIKELKTQYYSTSQTSASSFKPNAKEEANNDKMAFMLTIKANLFTYNHSSGTSIIKYTDEIESYSVFKDNIDKQKAFEWRSNNHRLQDDISWISKDNEIEDIDRYCDRILRDEEEGKAKGEDNDNKEIAFASLRANCNDTVVDETAKMEQNFNKTLLDSNIKSILMCPYDLVTL